jgi:hypothetical protein
MSVSNGQSNLADMAKRPLVETRTPEDWIVSACLDRLRELGPAVEIGFAWLSDSKEVDGELTFGLEHLLRAERFLVQTTRTHLSYALASGLGERARRLPGISVVFAPYVPAAIGRHLSEQGVGYVDVVGNCHLETKAGGLLVHVEGRKAVRSASAPGGGRLASYQLIFSILAQPELLKAPLRRIASAAGVGKSAVGDQLKRLTQEGIVGNGHILRRRDLLNRWLSAYPDVVRPAWLHGRYRARTSDPKGLEREIAQAWGERLWAFGAGAAAWCMNGHYRGEGTVIHVGKVPTDELGRLRALRDNDGPLTILVTPGTIAYAGLEPHLAHPLLVFTEMITSFDPRMREAAGELSERFLKEEP